MERNLEGKTAVITGGAKGIGYYIADRFLRNNAQVVIILDLDEKSGSETVTDLESKYGKRKAVFLKCNVISDLEKVSEQIISTYKTVDVLVNNAGCDNEESIKDVLALNTVAPVEWTMKFLEHMRTDAGGSGGTIINVSSVLGFIPCPFLPFYCASKFAVMGFSKAIGDKANYKTHGVRIIVLCPGFTRTSLVHFGQPPDDMPEEHKEYMINSKWQDPDSVGDAAVEMFRSADSGTAWFVNGGNPVKPVPSF